MGINFRGPTSIPDGSITTAKLANNAVDSTKLADNAVTTSKIVDDAVDSTKVTQSIATTHFTGTEGEYTSVGTTPFSVWEFNFTKDSAGEMDNWQTAGFSANIKTTSTGTVFAELFIDTVSVGIVQNSSTSYQVAGTTERDISSLSPGLHKAELRIYNGTAGQTAYINTWDVFLSKK